MVFHEQDENTDLNSNSFTNSNTGIYNRELSWLAFNNRVLQEAQDVSVPLMQRLRFLGIFCNNLDEFIKVRVAKLISKIKIKRESEILEIDGYKPEELLELINKKIDDSYEVFGKTYYQVLSEMENHGIFVLKENQLSSVQEQFCLDHFTKEISQWLVPLALRRVDKMPFLSDKQTYLAVKMTKIGLAKPKFAIIQIPINRSCPRFIELPSLNGKKDIIFIDDVIRLCIDEIFFMFNYDHISVHSFSFIRDGELVMSDAINKSIIETMEEGIEERQHAEPVLLTYDKDMPDDLLELILFKLRLKENKVLDTGKYQKMRDLMKFPSISNNLENINPSPLQHPDIKRFSSIINVLQKKDIFLNYPYHSFNHLVDFLREAAIDPKVVRLSITLYRTAERSKVINTLINAAKNGKEVVVLEELMARFDEEQNVENSELLQKGGGIVIHGFKNLKVHSKIVLVERKEKGVIRGYGYVGTGNFNESTAEIYGDFGLLTSNETIASDIRCVFDYLLNSHKFPIYKALMVSPHFMRKEYETLINQEIINKKKGRPAYIYAKFNSLTDVKIIKLLYKASQAGVEVRLIIRGACCIQPQVKGLSDNIWAISIVDKYLEHARTAIFCSGGEDKTYITSADWMTRNLDKRIEVGTPIFDKEIKKTIKDCFLIQWSDNVKARDLTFLDKNNYVVGNTKEKTRSQVALYSYYKKK